MKIILQGLMALCILGARPVQATSALFDTLDQVWIHERYNDGNFPIVIDTLQSYMAKHPTFSRHDSIFIAKHLAVVYSADSLSAEKGKHYMHRLLALLPSVDLVDMYVSEAIERVFERVRHEYQHRQSLASANSAAPPKVEPRHVAAFQSAAPSAKPDTSTSPKILPAAEAAAGNSAGSESKPTDGKVSDSVFRKYRPLLFGLAATAVGTTAYVLWAGSDENETAPQKVYHVR